VGLEPTRFRLEGGCSVQLSYGRGIIAIGNYSQPPLSTSISKSAWIFKRAAHMDTAREAAVRLDWLTDIGGGVVVLTVMQQLGIMRKAG
jgi:hypothetical protein